MPVTAVTPSGPALHTLPPMIGSAASARFRQRLLDSGRALVATWENRNLRAVELSFAAAWTAEWALIVALAVVAFRDGGPTLVGLVAFLRMAPPALLAPFSSALADRFRRDRVLLYSSLVRAGAIAAAAALLAAGAPTPAVYALAVLATCAFIVFRPAHSALLPALCTTPLELTSATVARGLLDSLSTLIGPLIAALLLSVGSPAAAFACAAALSLWSAVLVVGLSYEAPLRPEPLPMTRILTESREGFRALARHRDAGLLVVLALAQTFTRGCLNVLLVLVSFELLQLGEPGVGVLTAAVGAGAVAGSLGTLALVSGRRLAIIQGVGVALWGLPLTLCGALPYTPAVIVLLALIGVGNALVDVGLFTLLARLVPEELMGRVFGALESLIALTVAAGALVTPFLAAALGLRGALVGIGLVAPAVVAIAWRRLQAIDRSIVHRDGEIAVLQQVGMLRPLPMPTIENLAAHVGSSTVEAGGIVFRQGDSGDRFYVIADGEAEVLGDGRLVRTLGHGDYFGEIALLHDTQRTATVLAHTRLVLYTLDRADFLAAVSHFSASAREAETLLTERLATFSPRDGG